MVLQKVCGHLSNKYDLTHIQKKMINEGRKHLKTVDYACFKEEKKTAPKLVVFKLANTYSNLHNTNIALDTATFVYI